MTQHRQIAADLIELQDATASVRADTDSGLRLGLEDVASKIQQGVRFGRSSPSGEADAARQALLAALTRHQENSQRHISTAEQLANALQQIITGYTDVDLATKTGIAAVEETPIDQLLNKSPTFQGFVS